MLVEQIYEKDIHEKLIDLSTRNASIYIPKSLDYHRSPKLGVQVNLNKFKHSFLEFLTSRQLCYH
jgi:hypothetical protein